MDKIPNSVINSIKQLLNSLAKNDIKITDTVLFGSYAKGTFTEFSDIDVALVSDYFSGNRFYDKESIRKYVIAANPDISPLPFRPEDFNDNDLFVNHILKEGIRLS